MGLDVSDTRIGSNSGFEASQTTRRRTLIDDCSEEFHQCSLVLLLFLLAAMTASTRARTTPNPTSGMVWLGACGRTAGVAVGAFPALTVNSTLALAVLTTFG